MPASPYLLTSYGFFFDILKFIFIYFRTSSILSLTIVTFCEWNLNLNPISCFFLKMCTDFLTAQVLAQQPLTLKAL